MRSRRISSHASALSAVSRSCSRAARSDSTEAISSLRFSVWFLEIGHVHRQLVLGDVSLGEGSHVAVLLSALGSESLAKVAASGFELQRFVVARHLLPDAL
jgi:hypothetical protein